jgi:hypothetical protein
MPAVLWSMVVVAILCWSLALLLLYARMAGCA